MAGKDGKPLGKKLTGKIEKLVGKKIAGIAIKLDKRTLAVWAADCAEHVLHYFEEKHPKDTRPRESIRALRVWVRTGVFKMADVRKASLSAHAAAREAEDGSAARFAARAAGQAMATAHVITHAFGAAYYGAKAAGAAGAADEHEWQYLRLLRIRKRQE